MSTSRSLGTVVILAACVGLVPDPNPAIAVQPPPGGGENTIKITTIDTSVLGQANVGGTFTTKPGVELVSVTGYAYPTNGGIVSKGGGAMQNPPVAINNTTKLFTSVLVNDPALTNQGYAFRVEGVFSDTSIAQSQYSITGVKGGAVNNAATVNWDAGYAKSTAPKIISSQGTYNAVNTLLPAFAYASITAGGPIEKNTGPIAFTPDPAPLQSGAWKANDFEIASGGTEYSVLAIMVGGDGKTYCSQIRNVTPAK